mmetsp:Transcript_12527/g.25463  ORF Transcript_12527/g.25463 Transcript_12527/m.25463 type:complete len:83 (-) Transcript_12527:323-571(-)|eukprot:CAMPEP_0119058256 /NCGR_PEP_ID=MMETSP1178-20130426/2621_1 /TAXON_ID=33656 /ORGANISM="unid sp, Strain CCMP2000" /LENGTH=82 /DNA_ID=CAMNT_0007039171 /DNA_START=54 /DNA_END=302 /DNA_ORIENTATION=-
MARVRLLVASALLVCAGRASGAESEVPGAKFNKAELEAILKKEHSDRISNIFDSENGIQYTWDVENQELCPGVDGKCSKEEL